jgi:hypothetical protein
LDDELEVRQAGGELQEDGNVGEGAGDAGELGMVDDVLGGVGPEGLVQRDAVEGLGGQAEV